MCKINDVAEMSRLISNKSTQIDKLELKKMFIIVMASVPDPSEKEKELALKELEKDFDKRNLSKIVENNVVRINKQEFFNLMNVNLKKNKTAYETYKNLFNELVKSSHYTFDDGEDFISGHFIINAYTRKNMRTFNITLDPAYMPVFWHLKGGYVKLLTEDIVGFDSKYTMDLYKFIMSHTNKKEITFTTKQLKDLFGLSKDDYVSKKGRFERKRFEERTIDRALKEIEKKCKTITLIKQPNEKNQLENYSKIKENGKVKYYKITYIVTDPYQVINQEKQAQTTIDDFISEQEFPRSRTKPGRLQRSRHIQLQRIEEINQNLYNWLEE